MKEFPEEEMIDRTLRPKEVLLRGAVIRNLSDGGQVTLHRGTVGEMSPNIRRQLARLSLTDGENRDRFSSAKNDLFAVYAVDTGTNEIIGWVNWVTDESYGDNRRAVYVRRRDRNRGLGTVLVRESLRYLKGIKKPSRYFSTTDAPEFFNKVI